jgi:hypothetical protein
MTSQEPVRDAAVGVSAEIYAGDKTCNDTGMHSRLWALDKHTGMADVRRYRADPRFSNSAGGHSPVPRSVVDCALPKRQP